MNFSRRRTHEEPNGGKILLIDAEVGSAKVVSWMLTQNSYAVKHSREPTKAVKDFKKNPGAFEVVVVSARMPRMTGFELARVIRKIRPDIRIVLLTDFKINRSEFRKVFPSSQIDDMVAKPVEMRQLMQAITGNARWHAATNAADIGGVGEYQSTLR